MLIIRLLAQFLFEALDKMVKSRFVFSNSALSMEIIMCVHQKMMVVWQAYNYIYMSIAEDKKHQKEN